MIKTIIYSCVFFNETYINLINLLLKSYKLFGNSSCDVDYLIICNPDFQKKCTFRLSFVDFILCTGICKGSENP